MVRRAPPVIGRWLGELFTYIKFFKGGLRGLGCRLGRRWTVATGDHRPFASPHGGEVSPAGSVGVGKAPLALNASPAPPPTRRMSLSCREFRERETRPSKLHKVQLDSFAHPPRACLVRVRCLNLCSWQPDLPPPVGAAGGVTEGVPFQKIPPPLSRLPPSGGGGSF